MPVKSRDAQPALKYKITKKIQSAKIKILKSMPAVKKNLYMAKLRGASRMMGRSKKD